MSGFFGNLGSNLRKLPRNLVGDLHLRSQVVKPRRRMRKSFAWHIHPLMVTERALKPFTTMGLGLISAVLFGLLCLSGALLMIYYVPTPRGAYGSMLDIQHAVSFGPFVRALHRWAAHGMVVAVVLHLIRVLAMGCYRGRELNWFFGLTSLLFTLGLAFTGYLLPWDQRSVWAVVVSSSLLDHLPLVGAWLKDLFLGGQQVGGPTLLRFYMLHVAVLPTALLLLVALHLWRIRKDGGLATETLSGVQPAEVPSWPHLVLREGIVILLLLAGFTLLSTLVLAPLGTPPDFHHPSNPEKAPWFFLWLQEMVSYSAGMGGVIYPGLIILVLTLIPFLDREDEAVGRWFGNSKSRLALAVCLVSAVGAFGGFQLWAQGSSELAGLGADIFNPASGMMLLGLIWFALAGIWTGSTRAACLCLLAVLFVGVLGCIFMGLGRGPDWVFFWPWEAWPHGA